MNPTAVGDPSSSLLANISFSGNTGTVRFLNYSPYALAVSLRRGTYTVPPYCPRDMLADIIESPITWTVQYQLTGVSKNPASFLVIEAYDEGEHIPALPPSFSCPLVNIGNTTPVATSSQQVDATFSTSTTTPQVMTATAGTGLGVEDMKASGFIVAYPTATDATPRGVALAYIDSAGVLHIPAWLSTGSIWHCPAFSGANSGDLQIQGGDTGVARSIVLGRWTGSAVALALGIGNGTGAVPTRINDSGAIDLVANQATAGKYGVSLVIASTKDLAVTSSAGVVVCTVTSPNDGINHRVRVGLTFWIGAGNTNNGTITGQLQWTDPVQGATFQNFFDISGSAPTLLNGVVLIKGIVVTCIAIEVECTPNTTVQLSYQNAAAGTIADKASGHIELLA